MSDPIIDPKTIKDMRQEIDRSAKISEEKDARMEALQKST